MTILNKDDNSPLKQYRLSRGKTQLQVARELGIDSNRVSEYENGRSWVRYESIDSLANAYGCSPLELLKLLYETHVWASERN